MSDVNPPNSPNPGWRWVALGVGVGVFLLAAGLMFVVAHFGDKGAERAQDQVMTCMTNDGIWVEAWQSCVYGKGVL